jgi:uncharacterized protein YdiU (UPF0061 family)
LCDGTARDQFVDPTAYDSWAEGWQRRVEGEPDPVALQRASNPAFIPRNHRVEEMISAAVSGDYSLFDRLNAVLSRPYEDQPEHADLQRPPTPEEEVQATFCGT